MTNTPEQAPVEMEVTSEATDESLTSEETGQAEVEAGDNLESSSNAPKEGQASEELIAGKFKSQDELIGAYKNLESKLGQQGNELATLRQMISQNEAETSVDTSGLSNDTEAIATLNAMIEQRARQIMSEEIRPLKIDREISEAKENAPDFQQLLPDIESIYRDNPQLRQPGNLNLVIDMARGRQVVKMANDLKEEGKNEAFNQIKKTGKATTEGSQAKSFPATLTKDTAEGMSLTELEALLPKE